MKIAIVYGSTTGKTEAIARQLQQHFDDADTINVENLDPTTLNRYELLICGTSTWGLGELQSDWEQMIESIAHVKLEGKKVAFFGLGDQVGFPDSFVDGIATLHQAFVQSGAVSIGRWQDSGYVYAASAAAENGYFLGLPLDEDNQPGLTGERLRMWCEQLKAET
jgi:flavodoxin I